MSYVEEKKRRCVHCAAGLQEVAFCRCHHQAADSLEDRFPRCTAPTEAEYIAEQAIEIRGLRRRVHLLEGHNQHFERCESGWCNPGLDSNPAMELGQPDAWPIAGVKFPVNGRIAQSEENFAEYRRTHGRATDGR